jgi:hypothetical protein
MAKDPAYAATPRVDVVAVSVANTNRNGTGTIETLFTAPAGGSKIEEIFIISTGDPADCIVNIFLKKGLTWYFRDQFDLGNPTAGSATVPPISDTHLYEALVLEEGDALGASITATPTSGVVNVFSTGGDFEGAA